MTHSSRTIVVSYDISKDLLPQVILRTLKNNFDLQMKLFVGNRLDWKFLPDKHCIGYHALERGHSYLACPERISLTSGTQCKKCRLRDSLLPCIICNGSECRASKTVRDHCSTSETAIYIIAFSGNLKVGVSRKDRLLKRWLEQGADAGVEVSIVPNAKLARVIESDISKRFSILKSMRVKTKINTMFSKPSPSIFAMLDNVVIKVSKWIEANYPKCSDGKRRVVDLKHFYNLSLLSTPFSFIPTNKFNISGKFLGMKGPLFFFENDLSYFLDFRILRGRRILVKEPLIEHQLKLTNWT